MITRIAQRTKLDCAICAVAMVMGGPYSYARVLKDSLRYPAETKDGKFQAWWERYLSDEGFQAVYRPFLDLYKLPLFEGRVHGILVMMIPRLKMGHVVAADEMGIVDPADGAPSHIRIADYIISRLSDGFEFDQFFLAVKKHS